MSTEEESSASPSVRPSSIPASAAGKKKKQSAAEVQEDLRKLSQSPERPPVDLKKIYLRVGLIVGAFWVAAIVIQGVTHSWIPLAVSAVLTVAATGGLVWLDRYMKKSQALGAILKGADTEEGRKDALKRLDSDFKAGDVQALLAKAQLQMQEDPRAALTTLESIQLEKQMAPVAAQVRSMRAMIHLTLGETQEARMLVEKLDIDKQQDIKTRAMFAAVASEAWARTGNVKKATDTLDLFNPEDPDLGEMRAQLWRARAFAAAASNDIKAISRALKKLSDMSPHLLGMFVGQKKIHPLLEREAKQLVMKSGIVPRKMVRQRM